MSSSSSNTGGQKVVRKRKPADKVWVWGGEARYSVVLNKIEELGWKTIQDEKKESRCNLFWIDSATIHERFRNIQPWQMINHFPGMPNIARKNRMGQNLNKIAKVFPKEYGFYPRTWSLPAELSDFRSQFDPATGLGLNNKVFIIKPDAGCQGKGIFLVRSWDQVPQQEGVVAQLYIKKPLLIDGFKFDLRLYVLITSVKPLRMFLFQDGLVRLCTEPYVKPTKQNLSQVCVHLTNYAVNKNSSNFHEAETEDDDAGSKRSLQWFMQSIEDEHGEKKAKYLWKRFGTIAVRTVLSILPTLSREYDQHFKSFNNVPVVPPERKYYATSNSKEDNEKPNIEIPKLSQSLHEDSSDYDEGVEVSSARRNVSRGDDSSSIGLGGMSTCERAQDDDEEDEEDEEDENKDEGDGSAESNENKENVDKGSCRESRCFEILGIDVMIDSNLKPWLIEVNHLPSFGTDSPLDMDIKGRLMDAIFDILPVLPDDEDTYSVYHKKEAERRLTAERTTASSGKKREKCMTEKERKEEADKAERDRYAKKRAEFLRERERMLERQKAAAAASIAQAEEEERRRLEILRINQANADKHNRWLQNIYVLLAKIYTEHCPSKVNKIERLLDKYHGREEEFVNFVYDKYGIPFPIDLAPREALEELPPELTSSPEPTKNEELVESSSTPDVSTKPSRPPVVKSQSAGTSKDGRRNRYGELIRTPSPPQRRAPAAWRGDPDEEESFRQEVLNQHQPKEGDARLCLEEDALTSFYRIFPLFESDDAKESKEEEEDVEENDDAEEKECDGDDSGSTIPAIEKSEGWSEKDKDQKKKKKTPMWKSHEEVMCAVFLQDRRQTMRMKQPLSGQVKTANSESKDHLPALGDFSKPSSSFGKPPNGRSLPGWKPPPQRKESKVDAKVPGQYQMDVANRLSKGLSSSRQQNDEDKLTTSRNSNKMIVSARHRIYSNTCTSSGSAAGSIYTTSSLASQSGQAELGGGSTHQMYGSGSGSLSGNLLDPFGASNDPNAGYQGIEIVLNQQRSNAR
jgi:tubulin polyglutamylase TTLL6/13